ncbi:sterol desaturase family protein [Algibacter mikhailovii]|uniref:sterol desaturase family protein n=1 Tax=Algibacter mikhailovii TaxID=425498 RepID=UPI0024959896|nr:sterol desaturase family protein [Algibacter mikhailovii]
MTTLVFNPLVEAAPVLIGLLVLELMYTLIAGHENVYKFKDFLACSFMGLGAAVIASLIKVISAGAIFYVVYDLFNPEVEGVRCNILGYKVFGWAWFVWGICQFLSDFCHYWVHRLNHTVRIMWAAHVVHHSSQYYNFGTALRLGWVAMIYKPIFYMLLPAVGFHPEMVLVCMGIESVYQYLLHTSYCPKLKILAFIFITPKQHEVHHGSNKPYLDKNHGAIFNVFDRLFGTWKAYDENIEITYGVTHPLESYNPITIVSHEYRAIWNDVKKSKSLREMMMYVFGPPGWSPDETSLTVKQLQQIR